MGRYLRKYRKVFCAVGVLTAVVIILRDAVVRVLLIITGAAVLAFLLKPLCSRLERRMPRTASAVLSVLLTVTALLAALYLLIPTFLAQMSSVTDSLNLLISNVYDAVEGFVRRLTDYGIPLPAASAPDLKLLLSGTAALAGNIAGMLSDAVLICTLCCFVLADRRQLQLKAELLIPISQRRRSICFANAARREMYLYIRGQLMISLAVGILSAVGLAWVGVPAAMVLGFLVGILNMIPYFGPVIGSVPAVAMALQGGVMQALSAAAVLVIVQQIDGMILSPRIMGGLTGLSPAAILLIVCAGSAVSGIAGMLLALPCAMIIRTLYRVFVQKAENV